MSIAVAHLLKLEVDALKAKLVKSEERFEKLLDQAAGEIAELKAKLAEAEQRLARRAEHPSNAEKLADRVRIYKGKARRQKERAEKLAGASALLEHARDCHVETAKRAEKAEAEAAALRRYGGEWLRLDTEREFAPNAFCDIGVAREHFRCALSQPGPGAALLERVKKLEAVAEAALETRPTHLCKECVAHCYDCTRTEWHLSRTLAALDAPAAHDGDGDSD